MDKPILTVVMLVYNKAEFLADAIESVLGQKCSYKFKLLISDDSSTDGSLSIAKSYQQRFPDKIDIIEHSANKGLIGNSIDAFESVQTKYMAICDGDDFFCSKHKLQRQIDYMENHPDCAICFHKALNYYVSTGEKTLSNPKQKRVLTILDMATSNYVSSCTAMFRNHINGKLPDWFKLASTNDLPLNLLTASHGDIHFIPSVMSVYRKEYGNSEFAGASSETRLRNTLYSRYPLLNDPRWSEDVRVKMKETCAVYMFRLLDLYKESGDDAQFDLLTFQINDLGLTENQLDEAKRMARKPPLLSQHKGWKKYASKAYRSMSRLVPISWFKVRL